MNKLIKIVLVGALAACSSESTPPVSTPSVAALPAGLSRVADTSQVCMVNDQFMGRPQIPIAVEGRTYYGCCAMCKDRLGKDPATRFARDPVTGEQVDKSLAVIIQDASGKVMYFASEETLQRFRG